MFEKENISDLKVKLKKYDIPLRIFKLNMDVAIIKCLIYSVCRRHVKTPSFSSSITNEKNEILDAKVAILRSRCLWWRAMKYLVDLNLDDTIFQFVDSERSLL